MPVEFQDQSKFTKTELKTHEAVTIVGKKGSGKSVLFDYIMNHLRIKTFIVLIDTKEEYKHIPFLDLEHLAYKINDKGKKIYAFNKGLFRIIPGFEMDGEIYDDLFQITEWLSYVLFHRENSILAIEELGNCTKKHTRLYDCNPNFAKIIQQGRGRNIGFIGTTQRLQEIHTTILSESDHIICFRLTSEHDETYMKNYIKPEHIQNLKQFQFLHLNMKQDYLRMCRKISLNPEKLKYYTKYFGKT